MVRHRAIKDEKPLVVMKGTVYDKLRRVKELLHKDLKSFDERKLFMITSKLSTWHYPKKRTKKMTLSKDEAMVYEFYLNNGFNPSTVYKWMLACNTREDLQQRLMKGEIGLKDAMSQSRSYKSLSQVEAEFLYQVKLAIQKYVIR